MKPALKRCKRTACRRVCSNCAFPSLLLLLLSLALLLLLLLLLLLMVVVVVVVVVVVFRRSCWVGVLQFERYALGTAGQTGLMHSHAYLFASANQATSTETPRRSDFQQSPVGS